MKLPAIRLYTDNQSSIRIAKNTKTLRTKHLGAVYHYIRQEINEGRVWPIYIPKVNNVIDGLIRPLNGPEFRKFINLLGMKGEGEGNGDSKGGVGTEIIGMPAGE